MLSALRDKCRIPFEPSSSPSLNKHAWNVRLRSENIVSSNAFWDLRRVRRCRHQSLGVWVSEPHKLVNPLCEYQQVQQQRTNKKTLLAVVAAHPPDLQTLSVPPNLILGAKLQSPNSNHHRMVFADTTTTTSSLTLIMTVKIIITIIISIIGRMCFIVAIFISQHHHHCRHLHQNRHLHIHHAYL